MEKNIIKKKPKECADRNRRLELFREGKSVMSVANPEKWPFGNRGH